MVKARPTGESPELPPGASVGFMAGRRMVYLLNERWWGDGADGKCWSHWEHHSGITRDQWAHAQECVRRLPGLLAVIHRDGGHHTESVGLADSANDAQAAIAELLEANTILAEQLAWAIGRLAWWAGVPASAVRDALEAAHPSTLSGTEETP